MKHVIITGAAGFIGSHLVESFLEQGYAVTGIDNLITGQERNLAEALRSSAFQFIKQDICDEIPPRTLKFLDEHGLEGVLHFACPASPVDFEKIPFEILAVDSIGTIHTVALALQYGARYILASTSEIYGDPHVHPQKEQYWGNVNPIGPRACYDEAKRFAEAYVSSAIRGVTRRKKNQLNPSHLPEENEKLKLNGGIVRIFNTYGPRMRPNDGRVVPGLCSQALRGEDLTVYGDGKQTRSFCYVDDLVRGIVALYHSDLHEPVNLGNPIERTILDFAQAVNRAAEVNRPIQYLPARPDDPKKRCPDITRARELLRWEPTISLEEGLKRTIEYFRRNV